MPHLTLVGVDDGGSRLLLVDDTGTEHTLGIDGRLRAAVRGTTSRTGQLEITMDSTLRPRDIQARIRAGETPEAVAAAAQTTVEKIIGFAGPVIAERQHVAQRAQRSSVRRRNGEAVSPGVRTLGEAVAAHLRGQQVDPEVVEWDAWRREDGRWALTATYRTPAREGVASFSFDAPGSYVTLDDDDARWLVGEQVAAPRPATAATPDPAADTGVPSDDLSAARARRRGWGSGATEDEELPLGEDAIEMVSAAPAADPASAVGPPPQADAPGDAAEEDADVPDPATPVVEDSDELEVEQPPRRPVSKKRGRASVPSWDEIMFGGRDQ